MTSTSHPVAPEEIMAYLDAELSPTEAATIAAHLATCDECASIAEQLRETSQLLAGWTVPAMTSTLPESTRSEIARAVQMQQAVGQRTRTGNAIRSWKLAAVGGALAAFSILAVIVTANVTAHKKSVAAFQGYTLAAPEEEKGEQLVGRRSSPAAVKMPPAAAKADRYMGLVSSFDGGGGGSPASSAPDPAPMIARTVSITILVKDIPASRAVLDSLVAHHGGYAAQLNIGTPEGGPRGFDSSLRIPAPELTATPTDLRALGRVENETQSGEEVSQQHADLLARLQNSREAEDRLRAILQQHTGKVSDILEVEEEITRVRGEIEGMEAEQKILEHRVDFATVDVTLTEQFKATLEAPGDSVSTRLHNALVSGYAHASDSVVGIALFFIEYGPAIVVWTLFLGLPVFLIWRRRRSR